MAYPKGGAQGIGFAFCKALVDRGYRVGILDIAGYKEAAEALNARRSGAVSIGLQCDVTKDTQLQKCIATVVDKFGGLHVMCNNAGIASPLFDDIDRSVAINITAVIKGLVYAREHMKDGGVIVNVASVAGLGPVDFSPVYAATKAAVVNLTRSLAWLAVAENIRVCAICPNFTDTSMVRSNLNDASFSAIVSSQAGGLLAPEKVAEALTTILDSHKMRGDIIRVTAHKGIEVMKFPRLQKKEDPVLTATAKL